MSSEAHSSQENPNENTSSRRKRNSDGDRNHTCGCGKQYLSYPALYTHVKLKHHGQFPDGSTSKKPVELARNKVKLDQASRDELKDLRAEMRKYVDKFLSHKDASTQYSSDSRHPREPPTYFDAISLSELFPLEFLNKQHEGDVLHHHLHTVSKQIIDSDDEEDALFESLQDERLDRLIALFMIELGSLVPCKYADFMKESMLVGIFLSDTVKQASGTGEYIAKRIHQFGEDDDRQGEDAALVLEEYRVQQVPKLANKLVVELFPELLRTWVRKPLNLKFLGIKTPEKAYFLISTVRFFCNWLNAHKLTKTRIEINMEK